MAGICGLISKVKSGKTVDYSSALSMMMSKLGGSETQPSNSKKFSNFYFGNVTLFSDTENKNFIFNEQLGIYCVVDGLVYINEEEKKIILREYHIDPSLPEKNYLPYLVDHYKDAFINKITGWYNIFILDIKNDSAFLFNDRMGSLPLYIYENKEVFVFASKIESILASGVLKEITFDIISIAEHLFFNYTLSDNTFIKNIKTISPASFFHFEANGDCQTNIYWEFKELFSDKPGSKKEGRDKLDAALKNTFTKLKLDKNANVNMSLTGGWDSRVVLSFLMLHKNQLQLYSFGAKDSFDINIPMNIASSEVILYTPFILNKSYLDNEFIAKAKNTILQSNGTRHYKRTHYFHAFEKIARYSDTVVSGIYGDEVLKITGAKPGDVISKNTLDFIASDFNIDLITQKFEADDLWKFIPLKHQYVEEFTERMKVLKEAASGYSDLQKKYYFFRFQVILRKYFGAEINSYNDYCYNFSPFTDFDFLSAYFKSYYCGIYYPFNSNSLMLKRQTTLLYNELVNRNYKPLAFYPTDRGYCMADTLSVSGMFRILLSHFLRKRNVSDSFNTQSTTDLFKESLIRENLRSNKNSFPINPDAITEWKNANYLSLYFWMLKMSEKYITT